MNEELIKNRIDRTNEVYEINSRSIPNAFKMYELLGLKLKKYKFGEFVAIYKKTFNLLPPKSQAKFKELIV